MPRIRGFMFGKRLIRVSRWVLRKIRTRPGYHHLGGSPPSATMKLLTWGRKLKAGAKSLWRARLGSGYAQLGSDPGLCVPKGHLAVYVGQKGEFRRVLVPVIYFNHPLFVELLREAEEEYGFNHPGGIMIPCRVKEFERVKNHIASVSGRSFHWR